MIIPRDKMAYEKFVEEKVVSNIKSYFDASVELPKTNDTKDFTDGLVIHFNKEDLNMFIANPLLRAYYDNFSTVRDATGRLIRYIERETGITAKKNK